MSSTTIDFRSLGPLANNPPAYFKEYARLCREGREETPLDGAPQCTSESPWPTDLKLPTMARSFRLVALNVGWQITQTYAIGPEVRRLLGSQDNKAYVIGRWHTIALRMRKDDQRAFAIWGQWNGQGSWSAAGGQVKGMTHMNVTELTKAIKGLE